MDEIRKAMAKDPEGMLNEITKAADQTDSKELMAKELAELTETVKFIRSKFESVKSALHTIDSKNIRKLDSKGELTDEVMDKLEPRWEVHRLVRFQHRSLLVSVDLSSDSFVRSLDL